MESDDNYPNFGLMLAQEKVTEQAKTWSIGPRILWGVYLALGMFAMLVGAAGNIPSTGRFASVEMKISILQNIVRSILGI